MKAVLGFTGSLQYITVAQENASWHSLKSILCLGRLYPGPWHLGYNYSYQAIACSFKNPISVASQARMALKGGVGGQPHPHPHHQRRAFLSNHCVQERDHGWKPEGRAFPPTDRPCCCTRPTHHQARSHAMGVQLTEFESRQNIGELPPLFHTTPIGCMNSSIIQAKV